MIDLEEVDIDARYKPNQESRWKSYNTYKLLLCSWMLNDVSLVYSVTELSHNGYYIHCILHMIAAIFIGIPLVYSEICLAQYSNGGIISMWNFFPILRPVGYGTIYLVFLKTLYVMTITTWYLQYTFFASLDPPPWFSCDDFNTTKCMVKRVNVTVFQHCLEAQILFDDDCGMKTASNFFFEREIGDYNTMNSLMCACAWKSVIASSVIGATLFFLSLPKIKFIQIFVKVLAIVLCFIIFSLLSVAVYTDGAWYTTQIVIDWSKYNTDVCFKSVYGGFMSLGTGCGVIGFLSKDAPFRSPATMTSISVTLLSVFVTSMYALVIFSGIKNMSFFHGEEENVIEIGISNYFLDFASIAEILSYFNNKAIWGLIWFGSIFVCLFMNLWILYLFLRSIITDNIRFAQRHIEISNIFITVIICIIGRPIFCVDIAGAVGDAVEIIQLLSSLQLSVSLYWIYGYKNHNVDIIFMIGVKASFYWKIMWMINPLLIFSMLYIKWISLETQQFDATIYLESLGTYHDLLIIYVIVGIYGVIVIVGIMIELGMYFYHHHIHDAFSPAEDYGPKDRILFRSRKMFVPELMTREFLYRQIRIHGYSNRKKKSPLHQRRTTQDGVKESDSVNTEWSAFTSN